MDRDGIYILGLTVWSTSRLAVGGCGGRRGLFGFVAVGGRGFLPEWFRDGRPVRGVSSRFFQLWAAAVQDYCQYVSVDGEVEHRPVEVHGGWV